MVDLKELKLLVKYLRKEGITEFKSGDLEFKLGHPMSTRKRKEKVDVSEQVNEIPTNMPSQEELLFWSATGGPDIPKDS